MTRRRENKFWLSIAAALVVAGISNADGAIHNTTNTGATVNTSTGALLNIADTPANSNDTIHITAHKYGVTVTGNNTVTGLIFTTATKGTGQLTFAAANSLTVNKIGASDKLLSSVLVQNSTVTTTNGVYTGLLNVKGAGSKLTLNAGSTNAFLVAYVADGGTLSIANGAVFAKQDCDVVLHNGTLQVTGAAGGVNTAADLYLWSGGGTVDIGTGITAKSEGSIFWNGKLTKDGTGNLVLSGKNVGAGRIAVEAGKLSLASELYVNATKLPENAPIQVKATGTFEVASGGNLKVKTVGGYDIAAGSKDTLHFTKGDITVNGTVEIINNNILFTTNYAGGNAGSLDLTRHHAAEKLPLVSAPVADALDKYNGKNLFLEESLNSGAGAAAICNSIESGFNVAGRAGAAHQTLSLRRLITGASSMPMPVTSIYLGGPRQSFATPDYAPSYNYAPAHTNDYRDIDDAVPSILPAVPPPRSPQSLPALPAIPPLPPAYRGQFASDVYAAFWIMPIYGHRQATGLKSGGVTFGDTSNQTAVTFGIETGTRTSRIGVVGALGWGDTTSRDPVTPTYDDANVGGIYVFGSTALGVVDLNANVGWAGISHQIRQTNTSRSLVTDLDTGTVFASLGIERTLHCGAVRVTPSWDVEYSWIYQDSHDTLWGPNLAFSAKRGTAHVVSLPLGVRVASDWQCGFGVFTPEMRARYIPTLGDRDLTYLSTPTGAATGAMMRSIVTDPHAGDLGLGLTWQSRIFETSLQYDVLFSERFVEQNIGAAARWRF